MSQMGLSGGWGRKKPLPPPGQLCQPSLNHPCSSLQWSPSAVESGGSGARGPHGERGSGPSLPRSPPPSPRKGQKAFPSEAVAANTSPQVHRALQLCRDLRCQATLSTQGPGVPNKLGAQRLSSFSPTRWQPRRPPSRGRRGGAVRPQGILSTPSHPTLTWKNPQALRGWRRWSPNTGPGIAP